MSKAERRRAASHVLALCRVSSRAPWLPAPSSAVLVR